MPTPDEWTRLGCHCQLYRQVRMCPFHGRMVPGKTNPTDDEVEASNTQQLKDALNNAEWLSKDDADAVLRAWEAKIQARRG